MRIYYRELELEECDRISEIDASHFIKRVWRNVDGEYRLLSINYYEPDWPDGYRAYRDKLQSTIADGGFAIGAFRANRLVGFATLNPQQFGGTARYVLLDSMFVSREVRGKGIGKLLFRSCVDQARKWGADKLYLCASSNEDTVAFYKKLGCTEAVEINQRLYAEDERDIQLEYVL